MFAVSGRAPPPPPPQPCASVPLIPRAPRASSPFLSAIHTLTRFQTQPHTPLNLTPRSSVMGRRVRDCLTAANANTAYSLDPDVERMLQVSAVLPAIPPVGFTPRGRLWPTNSSRTR
jgi:hypothetical protein